MRAFYLVTYRKRLNIAQFLSNSCFKMELKNRSFQYGKVALAVRTQKHQLQFVLKVSAVCTDTCP